MNKKAKTNLAIVILVIAAILLFFWWYYSRITYLTLEEMREPADITQPEKGTGIDISFFDKYGNEIPIPEWFRTSIIVPSIFTIVTRIETAPTCGTILECPGHATNPYIVCHEGYCGLKGITEMTADVNVENPLTSTEKYLNINLDTVTSDATNTWYDSLVAPTTTFDLSPGTSGGWTCNPMDISIWEEQTITFFVKIEGTSELTQKISRPAASLTLKFDMEAAIGELIVTIEPITEPAAAQNVKFRTSDSNYASGSAIGYSGTCDGITNLEDYGYETKFSKYYSDCGTTLLNRQNGCGIASEVISSIPGGWADGTASLWSCSSLPNELYVCDINVGSGWSEIERYDTNDLDASKVDTSPTSILGEESRELLC